VIEHNYRKLIIYGAIHVTKKQKSKSKPGACIPWEQKLKEIPEISGDESLVQNVWEDIDALGNMYIWQCLLSF
jgi:hypothetical protein